MPMPPVVRKLAEVILVAHGANLDSVVGAGGEAGESCTGFGAAGVEDVVAAFVGDDNLPVAIVGIAGSPVHVGRVVGDVGDGEVLDGVAVLGGALACGEGGGSAPWADGVLVADGVDVDVVLGLVVEVGDDCGRSGG